MSKCSTPSTYRDVKITSQADIDKELLIRPDCWGNVSIYGAEGWLKFPNLTAAEYINVFDCPNLEELDFPELIHLDNLKVSQAEKLYSISIPQVTNGSSINITDSPNIMDLNCTKANEILELTLFNTDPFGFDSVTSIGTLVMDSNSIQTQSFPNLTELHVLVYYATQSGALFLVTFPRLESFGELTIRDGEKLGDFPTGGPGPHMIRGSLLMQNLNFLEATDEKSVFPYDMQSFSTIGQNASIISNTNAHMDFGGLVTVGGDVSIVNNTNCTFDMRQLSKVDHIEMVDNVGTILPFLPSLEEAKSIHLRGYLDTELGPNIFPSLKYVSGSVTIEAWNNNFNCSKLVSQWQKNITYNLHCNGTDNTTTSSPLPSLSSGPSHGLTEGGWAGIGVSIGIIVIGSIVAVVWLRLRNRRQQVTTADCILSETQQPGGVKPADLSGLHESDMWGVVCEAPSSGAIYEMAVPPSEKPDDHIRELAALTTAEMASGSPMTSRDSTRMRN